MRKFSFKAMKGFMALASAGSRHDRADPLVVVALAATAVTITVVALYLFQ